MIQLNKLYQEDDFYPSFYIFATDGGDMAYLFEKKTGNIYEVPFIGDNDELRPICKTFTEFIEEFPNTPI